MVLANIATAEESRLVSVGDHKLEVRIQGEGRHTIVLESGLGHDLTVWQQVADSISQSARVVSYSRSGYGQSETSDKPRTLLQIATELDALLLALEIDNPVILVGHSAGGFYVRKYAELHPEKVQGFVFVDATPEQIFLRLRNVDRERALEEEATIASMTPDRVKPEDIYFSKITRTGVYPGTGILPDVPTALISALRQEYPQFLLHSVEGKKIWLELQTDFVNQFSDHLHIVSSVSGHDVHRQYPEIVVDAIEYVMRQVSAIDDED
jgi:pimeloyl-ACP methyl ester carboxylesterase